jgi:hypothetical protein
MKRLHRLSLNCIVENRSNSRFIDTNFSFIPIPQIAAELRKDDLGFVDFVLYFMKLSIFFQFLSVKHKLMILLYT